MRCKIEIFPLIPITLKTFAKLQSLLLFKRWCHSSTITMKAVTKSHIFEMLAKIKNELKIDSFDELTNYLEKLYNEITNESDIARKNLKFMDGMSKYTNKVRKEN